MCGCFECVLRKIAYMYVLELKCVNTTNEVEGYD